MNFGRTGLVDLLFIGKDVYMNYFLFPFEWIAAWLRKLSLSGSSGNYIAITLYIIICSLPAIAFLLLCLRSKKIHADHLLLLCSAALFTGIYLMINPGLLTTNFHCSIPMLNLAVSTTLWSVFVCYIIFRILAMIERANELNLVKIAQFSIILVMILSILNICFIKLPDLITHLKQPDSELYSQIVSSTDGIVSLDNSISNSSSFACILLFLCDLLPSLLFIWVLSASLRLCRTLKDSHFSDQTADAASALSHLCIRVLCITAVLEVVRNILQLLMLPTLSDTNFTLSLPVIEIVLTVMAFILAKRFETAHTLEEENEAFI